MDSIIPPAILTVATLVNNALSSAKSARELAKSSTDSGLKAQISDLYDALLDMKERVLELDGENRSLRQKLADKAKVRRDPQSGYFYIEGDDEPLCPNCYEGPSRAAVHLTHFKRTQHSSYVRHCKICGDGYLHP